MVVSQATIFADPGDCSPYGPPPLLHDEAALVRRTGDDCNADRGGVPDPIAPVGRIRPDPLDKRPRRREARRRCGAARESCMSAGETQAASNRPPALTRMWRFITTSFLPPSYPFVPPVSLVLTDWLSMTAAVGEASHPSRSRSSITRRWLIRSNRPVSRHA